MIQEHDLHKPWVVDQYLLQYLDWHVTGTAATTPAALPSAWGAGPPVGLGAGRLGGLEPGPAAESSCEEDDGADSGDNADSTTDDEAAVQEKADLDAAIKVLDGGHAMIYTLSDDDILFARLAAWNYRLYHTYTNYFFAMGTVHSTRHSCNACVNMMSIT